MLVGGRPQVLWEGLAELRADAPSKARGAEGERGRPPPSSNTQCPITPGTRQTRPTKIVTFPRDKAEKSPFQQHDLSILIVGPNQRKDRLSRIRKPKSRVIGHRVWVGGRFQERRTDVFSSGVASLAPGVAPSAGQVAAWAPSCAG